ncbi:hypothetical protein [Roseivirga thermotolerans]|uniref:hypothetical protein n=1 Tax=Roseivirga thermotolerans TaxID=1758176 RepID=UPI00273E7C2B|nr:hypothetical protein [Roseivirga thermotolerans]
MERTAQYVLISEAKPGSKKTAGSLLYQDIGKLVSEHGDYKELVIQEIPELQAYIDKGWSGALKYSLTPNKNITSILDEQIPEGATVLVMLRGWSHLIMPGLISLKKKKQLRLVAYDSDGVRSEMLRFKFAFPLILLKNASYEHHFDFVWAASPTLKQHYLDKSIESEMLVKPIEGPIVTRKEPRPEAPDSQKTLNVFFAGNIYSKGQFDSFLQALGQFASAKSVRMVLHVCSGDSIESRIPESLTIQHHGWVTPGELDTIAEQCDFAYLPYPGQFYKRYYLKYAFPTKFGLYVSKGLPVFYHGPLFRNFDIIDKDSLGVCSDSKNSKELLSKIIDLTALLPKPTVQEALMHAAEAYTFASFKRRILQGLK